ncbi:type 1 glutamine amidotransferase [Marinobacter bryozoorum]|jgi:protease I|uniref:type 1 glutamine amidotransferase domain-containing protein n=1 Tax=Marinobacter bryozoorum TaxID=256324 RepID=UPI002004ADBA|nr:type 1 glutamine amidotransferase domain-containing protein [Marinobacter bryozoorum]MCK7545586.1 type 1 glutamine amidotransferase [Marinobacter bryozoorum]
MSASLKGKKVAFLATDGVEQVELTDPREALEKAGAETELVSIKEGSIDGFHHLDKGDTFKVDKLVGDVDFNDYDALVLPGGVANPDELRQDRAAVAFARSFVEAGKPVAAICHAPWLLVEANVVRGRTLTSFPSVKTDIVNAGGHWVDEKVCHDAPLITSRNPDDLEAFSGKIIEVLGQ